MPQHYKSMQKGPKIKISHPKCLLSLYKKITKMGKILAIFAIFLYAVVPNGETLPGKKTTFWK
jgi:hypothetical protein